VTAHVRRIKGPAAADGQVGQIHGVSTMNTSQALMPARCYRFAATAAYSLSFTLGGGFLADQDAHHDESAGSGPARE
jgi:hypothetical protein